VAFQRQVHSDIVTIVDKGMFAGESDALITDKPMVGLAISTADCTPIFIYDKKRKVIAGVHSGWRGTEKGILAKTIVMLKEKFICKPVDLIVFVGPSISQKNYEVGEEVASKFHAKYCIPSENGKYLLDVKRINYDLLIEAGVPECNIEVSGLCSFGNENLHSYRRDKEVSGRALGIIAMRNV
jgi:YfiH family protein